MLGIGLVLGFMLCLGVDESVGQGECIGLMGRVCVRVRVGFNIKCGVILWFQ